MVLQFEKAEASRLSEATLWYPNFSFFLFGCMLGYKPEFWHL